MSFVATSKVEANGEGSVLMSRIVAGVDVGGPRKGFHAVALRERVVVAKFHSRDPDEMAHWIRGLGVDFVAIDAPCRWREIGGPARAAEREMGRNKISSFSTPTEDRAAGNSFYTWMIAGMSLYRALFEPHPLYDSKAVQRRGCFETFPQAVACALAGGIVSAKKKNRVRRALLDRLGIDAKAFANIDEVDAALCAIAAEALVAGRFWAYGDQNGGFIIVPKDPAN